MKFIVQSELILCQDDLPGDHATLLGPKGPLALKYDACAFDDATRSYTWAFTRVPLKKGQVVVFATVDREVVGEVDATGQIIPSARKVNVVRGKSGAPAKFTKKLF